MAQALAAIAVAVGIALSPSASAQQPGWHPPIAHGMVSEEYFLGATYIAPAH